MHVYMPLCQNAIAPIQRQKRNPKGLNAVKTAITVNNDVCNGNRFETRAIGENARDSAAKPVRVLARAQSTGF